MVEGVEKYIAEDRTNTKTGAITIIHKWYPGEFDP